MQNIKTERLLLRAYQPEDLVDLYEYLSDAEVVRFEPYRPMELSMVREEQAQRMENAEFIAVEQRATGKLIGNLYLAEREFMAMELGFVFNRAYWGNGYAKESAAALINQAFADGTHRIFAECDPENTRSWRLLAALGFAREGMLHRNVYFWQDEQGRPIWKDTYIYSLLNPETER